MSNLTKSIPADERKMLRKAFWRSFTLYAAVSPAKQGASGFCYSLMPFINKFYKNDEEGKKAALTRSMSYFNTTITLSTFIMGLVASMEKKNSEQKDFDASSINAVKSSLMGPLAGIGDSIFWGRSPCNRSRNRSRTWCIRKRSGTDRVPASFSTFRLFL